LPLASCAAGQAPSRADRALTIREYAVRHYPPPYYTTLTGCATYDVPYAQLAIDLADNTLPAFSFVSPNVIDDMHDGTIAQGGHLAGQQPAGDLQQRRIPERDHRRVPHLG
jgi:Phosphoesterase family